MKKTSLGFTLVEVLVVASMIALLSSIVVTTVNDARVKARDLVRVSEVRVLVDAIRAYHLDHGTFPTYQGSCQEERIPAASGIGTYANTWDVGNIALGPPVSPEWDRYVLPELTDAGYLSDYVSERRRVPVLTNESCFENAVGYSAHSYNQNMQPPECKGRQYATVAVQTEFSQTQLGYSDHIPNPICDAPLFETLCSDDFVYCYTISAVDYL